MLKIARDALLDLRQAPLHLRPREVLVPVIDRLELAAIDRNTRFTKQAHRAAQRHEASTHPADGTAIVLAEIGDRLVVGNKPPGQPHDLDIAPGLALELAARLEPVQIAVNVELQEDRGMV